MDPVTILIASTNIKSVIELCIKSVIRYTKYPYKIIILDSSDKYKKIEYLENLNDLGKIILIKKTDRIYKHDEALDEMFKFVNTKYFITLDSDVEIIKKGWLKLMVEIFNEKEKDLLTCLEFSPHKKYSSNKYEEYLVPGGKKYGIWMSLYKTQSLKRKKLNFKIISKNLGVSKKGKRIISYEDTGIHLFRKLKKEDRVQVSREILDYFIHYKETSCWRMKIPYFKANYSFFKFSKIFGKLNFYKKDLKIYLRNKFYFNKRFLKYINL